MKGKDDWQLLCGNDSHSIGTEPAEVVDIEAQGVRTVIAEHVVE
jgi:hypothetical protein